MTNLEQARSEKLIGIPVPRTRVSWMPSALPREWIVLAAGMIFILALWEVLGRAEVVSPIFFPMPSMIASALWNLGTSGELVYNTAATLLRLGLGFLVGGSAGLLLGLVMGYSQRARVFIDPLVAATNPLPKIALLPLAMIIFGFGENARIVLISVATFYPMLLNTMAAVRGIHPLYFEAAENYGASGLRLWTRVVLPGSLPLVLVGTRIALNVALLLVIAIEMVSSQNGLGQIIWLSWETLHTADLYAVLCVIAGIGIVMNAAIGYLTARLTPWHRERARD